MSRWLIEKSGTGIEKSGTGIEKSGTGIEKSGTGIEKSGTGIEKSGTGIRRGIITILLTAITFASHLSASVNVGPSGAMTLVIEENTVAVSWIIDGSVFSGVASLSGSFANVGLTEIGLAKKLGNELEVAGSGSGSSKEVAGAGSGVEVAGAGSGVEVAGAGSGVEVAGAGSGVEVAGAGSGVEVAGAGSGVEVAGAGSGTEVAGAGSGEEGVGKYTTVLIAGSGSGTDAIVITLPNGTDMQMEVALGCNSATVSILDSNFVEVVSFSDVPVFGASQFCGSGSRGPVGYENGYIAYNDAREPTLSFEDK